MIGNFFVAVFTVTTTPGGFWAFPQTSRNLLEIKQWLSKFAPI
jgi:hypothetical protein